MLRPRNASRIPIRWSPIRRRDVRDILNDGLSHGQFEPTEQGLAEDIVRALKGSGPQLTRDQVETARRLLARLIEAVSREGS